MGSTWCRRSDRQRAQRPRERDQATREYEISEDTLASFVQDECFLGPHWWCEVGDFRSRYEQHCEEMGVEQKDRLSAKALTMRLTTEYAVTPGRLSRPQRRTYIGIALQGEDE
jgi:hypothetical protein